MPITILSASSFSTVDKSDNSEVAMVTTMDFCACIALNVCVCVCACVCVSVCVYRCMCVCVCVCVCVVEGERVIGIFQHNTPLTPL